MTRDLCADLWERPRAVDGGEQGGRSVKGAVIKSAVAMIVLCILIPVFLFAGQDAHRHLHNDKQIPQDRNPLMEEMVHTGRCVS